MKSLLAALALAVVVGSPAAAQTFSNTTPVNIPDSGSTSSTIVVGGASGPVTGLTVTLKGLSHTYPSDLAFFLVNTESNTGIALMSGSGGSHGVTGVDLTFSDSASSVLPLSALGYGPLTTGSFKVSNFNGDMSPAGTTVTSLLAFNGLSKNGHWRLDAFDTAGGDTGSLSGGWSLSFATSAVPEPATWAMMITGFGLAGATLRRRRARAAQTA